MTRVWSAAVLYVKDLRRMSLFYRACFQMDVVDEAHDYRVLESDPLTLSPEISQLRRRDVAHGGLLSFDHGTNQFVPWVSSS